MIRCFLGVQHDVEYDYTTVINPPYDVYCDICRRVKTWKNNVQSVFITVGVGVYKM